MCKVKLVISACGASLLCTSLPLCSLQCVALLHTAKSKYCVLPSFVARIASCSVYGTTKHLHHTLLPAQVELHVRVDAAWCTNYSY